ncbi:succinate dehydrogenase / fumarate reductase cytochrome b subunit [Flavobacterium aquaticum]|uniref:Succinate dehydrogenase / fumarate reductase cytochrome b subunit n=1 Tax=Flavobacterium aquaticum TaxID=1236486 RepID=A0A327YTY2_9FLAO|nr:succinate dehydrogenase cytochrome b subunit [Flavobacterium aquaticum]RAK23826.1 succinate dehydrogenase / fumarate reductase cytochrome b subunit [Flavobacterium aquaticum]
MAKSALLKSSIVKKYWMALTGLFLCLFLAGHLAGNLQLIFGTSLQFNEYALFMTTNPAVKLLSYLTYISIIFHAIDGIMLTIQNKKARPIGYAKTDGSSSSLASRNMAVLGTVILVFIATHMTNFWAKMHFDKNMPLMTKTIEVEGNKQQFYVGTNVGQYYPVEQVAKEGEKIETKIMQLPKQFVIKNRTELYYLQADVKTADLYKDLHKLTVDFFKDPKLGLAFTAFYVLSMLALAFHLWHGFQSAFQSLGVNSSKLTPVIKFFGKAFAIIVPLLFAIIPIILHFKK